MTTLEIIEAPRIEDERKGRYDPPIWVRIRNGFEQHLEIIRDRAQSGFMDGGDTVWAHRYRACHEYGNASTLV